MAYYKFGPLLRERRIALGYTQEALADGICAVNTLSRYENGERMPNKEHLEMLLSRLGLSDAVFDAYLDKKSFYLHELKYKIRQAAIHKRYEESFRFLNEFERLTEKDSPIARQFLLLYRTDASTELSNEEKRKAYQEALMLTCPLFESRKDFSILSFEEIILPNHIAAIYHDMGDQEKAIDLYYKLKLFYETGKTNQEEKLRTQTSVLYNLSTCLGCAGRYEECIEICNLGIRIARETGKCRFLSWMFYNKAWALVKEGKPGSMEAARESVQLARNMAIIMDDKEDAAHFDRFIANTF